MFVKVAINGSINISNRTFDYNLPKEMESLGVFVGSRVLVFFGRRLVDGYVVGFCEKSEYECKDVVRVFVQDAVAPEYVAIAKTMAKRYFAPLYDCIRLFSPTIFQSSELEKESFKKIDCVEIANIQEDLEKVLVEINTDSEGNISDFLDITVIQKYKKDLTKKQAQTLRKIYFLKEFLKEKITVANAFDLDELIAKNDNISNEKRLQKRMQKGLESKNALDMSKVLIPDDIVSDGIGDGTLQNHIYLPISFLKKIGITKAMIDALLLQGLLVKKQYMVSVDYIEYIQSLDIFFTDLQKPYFSSDDEFVYNDFEEQNLLEYDQFGFVTEKSLLGEQKLSLTSEQQVAFDGINDDIMNMQSTTSLVFGVTGSGKTEVYLQLISSVLQLGKCAIMLVPEISLTPQIVQRFKKRFPNTGIGVFHSKITKKEKKNLYANIQKGNIQIVIGARSAIFAPLKNIGIVILDEEHDNSYKAEQSPRYFTHDIAKAICNLWNCPLVLGSATPHITTYHMAKKGDIALYELSKRAQGYVPDVKILDMRFQDGIICKELLDALKENMQRKKKSVLFLNKRGYYKQSICPSCGHILTCKNCNVSYTYHKEDNTFKCHYCGDEKNGNCSCPVCGSALDMKGFGTQKLKEFLEENLGAKVLRMDADTTSTKDGHEKILSSFQEEDYDILVGTQMVVKGHHFKDVTLSASVLADNLLAFESYRADFNCFANLTQLIGRSAREEKGVAYIQAYDKDNPIFEYAKNNDYKAMYEEQILVRKGLYYPPFSDILQIRINGKEQLPTQKQANIIHQYIVLRLEHEKKLLEKQIQKLENDLQSGNSNSNTDGILKEIAKLKSIQENFSKFEIYKAIPFKIDRICNSWRFKILIKCKFDVYIARIIQSMLDDPKLTKNVTVTVDVNPLNI